MSSSSASCLLRLLRLLRCLLLLRRLLIIILGCLLLRRLRICRLRVSSSFYYECASALSCIRGVLLMCCRLRRLMSLFFGSCCVVLRIFPCVSCMSLLVLL